MLKLGCESEVCEWGNAGWRIPLGSGVGGSGGGGRTDICGSIIWLVSVKASVHDSDGIYVLELHISVRNNVSLFDWK